MARVEPYLPSSERYRSTVPAAVPTAFRWIVAREPKAEVPAQEIEVGVVRLITMHGVVRIASQEIHRADADVRADVEEQEWPSVSVW